MDKLSKVILENYGIKNVIIGTPNKFNMSIAIYNDMAICSIFEEKFIKERDKIYKKSDNNVNPYGLIKCISEITDFLSFNNMPVRVLIIKNSDLVKLYKDYILSLFEDKKDSNSSEIKR